MTFPAEASTQASFPNTRQNSLYNNQTPVTPAPETTSAFQPFVRQPRPAWPFPGQIQQYPSHYGNANPPLGTNFPFQPPTFYQNPTPPPTWPFPGQIQQNTHSYENSDLAFRTANAFSGVFTPPYFANTMPPHTTMSWQDPMQYFHAGQTPSLTYANSAPSQHPTTDPAVPKPIISNPEKTNKSRISSRQIVIDQEVIDQCIDKRPNDKRVSPKSKVPIRKINESGDLEIQRVLKENPIITLEIFDELAKKIKGPGKRRIYNRLNRLNTLNKKTKKGVTVSKDVINLYRDKRPDLKKNKTQPRWTEEELKLIMRPQLQEQSNKEYIEETASLIHKDLSACKEKFYLLRQKDKWSPEEDARLLAVLDPTTRYSDERMNALFKLSQEFGTIKKTCKERYNTLCNLRKQQRLSAGNVTSVACEPETTTSTTSTS